MVPTLLSIAMLAVLILVWAGIWLIVARRDPNHGALMVTAGLVILGNILIWTL